jgi:hypothetical protein
LLQCFERHERRQAVHGEAQPEPRIGHGQDHEDAGDEEGIPKDVDGELGEEVGEQRHVAVDPLDQLTRRMSLVEGEVES